MKVEEFAEKWLAMKEYSLAPLSFDNYQKTINELLIPFMGDKQLEELSSIDVQVFCGFLVSRYTPTTAKRKYAVVRAFFRKAYALGYCQDLMRGGVEMPRVNRKNIQYFDKADIDTFLSEVDKQPLKWKVLFTLALDTGARRGELMALTWNDIDLEKGRIIISKSLYTLNGQTSIKSTKSGQTRVVYVTGHCLNLLREYRALSDVDRLFTFRIDYVSVRFKEICKKCGLEGHFHCLRHTCATSMLRNGIDLQIVKDRLGHSSITTTALYLHSNEEADQEASKLLEDFYYNK